MATLVIKGQGLVTSIGRDIPTRQYDLIICSCLRSVVKKAPNELVQGRSTSSFTNTPAAFSLELPFNVELELLLLMLGASLDDELGLEAGYIRIERFDLSPGIMDSSISW